MNLKLASLALTMTAISIASIAQDTLIALEYRNVGPTRGGRVTAVSGIDSKPGTFFMGATGGGVWKTEDYGFHWQNVSDGFFASPSIGAIAVYQKDPDIIYVGTGSDGIRSNVIVGKGIYKSEDEGRTWTFSGLPNAGQIGAVLIHPDNPDMAYAAVIGHPFRKSRERGVFRTKDGGSSWENVLFHSDSVGCVDLEFSPDNPDIIYAAMWRAERKPWTIISGGASDGIFKSSDGGDTWQRQTTGLPTGLIGKIDLAVSPADPSRVWALIQASDSMEGLYRSDDYGTSWTHIAMPDNVHTSIMYRPFYFTNLHVNPQNADHIWSGTKAFWTSRDGGAAWTRRPISHADHHAMWIHPTDTLLMIEGNDGGAAVSRDGGQNWSTLFNQPTAELYSCYVDDQFPYYLYSGQQDNSTIRVPSDPPFLDVLTSNDHHDLNQMMFWERVGGCETGPVIAKPGNPHLIYANCKGQFSVYNTKTGLEQNYYVGAESLYGNHPNDITYRFQRVTPMEVSPHDPNTVYYGSQYLHKTTTAGELWETISPDLTANEAAYRMRSGGPIDEDISGEEYYNVLYAIEESAVEPGVIWTGSNDGLFHVTRDGGKNWQNVTPKMPGQGRVANIEVSPHNAAKAYYAVYRDFVGDDRPYLYKTEDYGKNWQLLTDGANGIPDDYPTRVVREDPEKAGLLYAGTEFGIFISLDDGQHWQSFQRNLPIVPVTDIRIHRDDLVLSTLGRSFWIMDDISPIRYLDKAKGFQLFKPRNTLGGIQFIYFSLPEDHAEDEIRIEFFEDGKLIHSKREKISLRPSNAFGIRRTEWDLRHYLPNGKKDFQGPLVAPGTYSVRMTFAKEQQSQTFEYALNPEIIESGLSTPDIRRQEQLSLEIAHLLIDIETEIRSLEAKIHKNDKDERSKDRLHLLKKGPQRYDQPMLADHVKYLYEMVSDTPQRPGSDAYERYITLKGEWEAIR